MKYADKETNKKHSSERQGGRKLREGERMSGKLDLLIIEA